MLLSMITEEPKESNTLSDDIENMKNKDNFTI